MAIVMLFIGLGLMGLAVVAIGVGLIIFPWMTPIGGDPWVDGASFVYLRLMTMIVAAVTIVGVGGVAFIHGVHALASIGKKGWYGLQFGFGSLLYGAVALAWLGLLVDQSYRWLPAIEFYDLGVGAMIVFGGTLAFFAAGLVLLLGSFFTEPDSREGGDPKPEPFEDVADPADDEGAGDGTETSIEQRLVHLEDLHERGVISDTEYVQKRQRIIDEL